MSEPPRPSRGGRYVLTLAALVALTAASWGLAQLALGELGPAIALGIAAAKASLVALLFMEIDRYGTASRVVAVVTVVFIALLCLGTGADVAMR